MVFWKLLLLVFLPIFSYCFLRRNKKKLEDPDFSKRYITLYANLKTNASSAYLHTALFSSRRLLIIWSTIYLNDFLITNIFLSIFSSLYIIKYLFDYNPYKLAILNKFEKMNEIFTLISCYSMILFSELVPDVMIKYQLGFYFLYYVVFISLVNVTLVFYDLFIDLYSKIKRKI
jgi:hypothetical protein